MELSLQQLGLDYVDLMLVHFPAAWSGQGGKMLRLEEWRAMEAFQKSGKAKAIAEYPIIADVIWKISYRSAPYQLL